MSEVLTRISQTTHELVEAQYQVLNDELLPALEREGIRFAHREVTVRLADGKVSDLDDDQREAVTAAAQAAIDEDMHDAAQQDTGDDR